MTSAQTVASANGAATEQTPAAVTASRTAGTTLWLTGLPSAGKTTLALALAGVLREQGADVEVLDGD